LLPKKRATSQLLLPEKRAMQKLMLSVWLYAAAVMSHLRSIASVCWRKRRCADADFLAGNCDCS
jgi:hypothetical protein